MSRTVEVRVAGQNYRVVSSAPEGEVRRLADAVNAKLAELFPKGRAAPPNALLLAAIALAHDLEEERERRESVEERARELLQRVVAGIDEVLGEATAADRVARTACGEARTAGGEAAGGDREARTAGGEATGADRVARTAGGEAAAALGEPVASVGESDAEPDDEGTREAPAGDAADARRSGAARKGAAEAPPAVREVSRET